MQGGPQNSFKPQSFRLLHKIVSHLHLIFNLMRHFKLRVLLNLLFTSLVAFGFEEKNVVPLAQ